MVRNLDLVQFAGDAQRLEVVADGLPLFGGAQLAIDTTLVSALVAARRRKERTYREVVGLGTRARLVVPGVCLERHQSS